jgi:predicted SAM-dependent methyltransferase
VKFRSRFEKLKGQLSLRKEVKRLQAQREMVKIIIGAGPTSYEGWLATDLPLFNALRLRDWYIVFPIKSIDRILAEHVIEHWSKEEFCSCLQMIRSFLTGRGFVRIAIPDGFHPNLDYINQVKPGGSGAGATDHKVLYNYLTLTDLLITERYDYKLLEYFDEVGTFHCVSWEINDGLVRRSANHDARNQQVSLTYTSLIVDLWPKK